MEINRISFVYFSATYTTRKIVRQIAKQFEAEVTEYDITQSSPEADIILGKDELLIVGMPVYAGRIPAKAAESLSRFRGENTPVILVCVYGNREYDDALIEMKDITDGNGFKVFSAGAFIAQHSIFPKLATKRPDEADMAVIQSFGSESAKRLKDITDMAALPEIMIKGNRPYKTPGAIPLYPKGNRRCDDCGTCVKSCPVQAIPADKPRTTNKDLCISCGRCIVVCPRDSRHFGGLLYLLAGRKLVKNNSLRKEPQIILPG